MPTREEYIDYALSLCGPYGAGAGHAENDTPFNLKFYGHRVSGSNWAWCRVYEWFVDDHFGIAVLNGGKTASCPASVEIGKKAGAKTWHKPKRGSKAYTPCNKILYDFNKTGESEHTGIFWKPRDSTTFWAVEGNTGNDQVAKRIRRYSDVLDVVETLGLDGTTTKGSDDVPDYVSLTTEKSMTVEPDKEFFVKFDKEISDKAKRHNDAGTEGIFVAGKNGSVYTCQVILNGPATWSLCEMQKENDGSWSQHDHNDTGEIDLADAGSHVWLKVTPHQHGDVTVVVKCAVWDR